MLQEALHRHWVEGFYAIAVFTECFDGRGFEPDRGSNCMKKGAPVSGIGWTPFTRCEPQQLPFVGLLVCRLKLPSMSAEQIVIFNSNTLIQVLRFKQRFQLRANTPIECIKEVIPWPAHCSLSPFAPNSHHDLANSTSPMHLKQSPVLKEAAVLARGLGPAPTAIPIGSSRARIVYSGPERLA